MRSRDRGEYLDVEELGDVVAQHHLVAFGAEDHDSGVVRVGTYAAALLLGRHRRAHTHTHADARTRAQSHSFIIVFVCFNDLFYVRRATDDVANLKKNHFVYVAALQAMSARIFKRSDASG